MTLAVPNGSIHLLTTDAPIPSKASPPLPIVFVHGMACSANIWETQMAYTAQTRSAIAIDLRGHGDSTPPADNDYSPAACATDLFAVLAALELEQIVLVGHSFGACVALAAAAAKPQAIAQLVLVDPPVDCTQLPPEVYEEQLAPYERALATDNWRSAIETSFRQALTGGTPATYESILDRLSATPKAALIGTSHGLFGFKALDALDRYLAAPGAKAHAILAPSNNMPFSLHILRPALTTTTLPATGHWLMLDAPEAFASALNAYLTT
ncbi:alpha/beta fold hydrolase [Pantanalinema rosaneae]|uniref:alpha/beta fold hydrolase n=1 Tax=Pantanalinema rosaneae TaxID=1620701 RepID=UPI003D6F7741